ncbi:MAG: DUF2584 family protein [Spirochaetes bacterium]|nr:DUF2584 family protein [Spirochaetota bacterium]
MRYQTEFNYILKIREGQGLPAHPEINKVYSFEKTIERVYPLNLPILLVDDDYHVYGKCIILEFTVSNNLTKGKYKIFALFDNEKRKIYTEDLLHSVEYAKNLK